MSRRSNRLASKVRRLEKENAILQEIIARNSNGYAKTDLTVQTKFGEWKFPGAICTYRTPGGFGSNTKTTYKAQTYQATETIRESKGM